MEEAISSSMPTDQRTAMVTGGNTGLGFAICKQLAASGVMVMLTARDEKKGMEAMETLKGCGLSNIVFHQLDVTDTLSIARVANFVRTHFGKLDILVNNAGVSGAAEDLKSSEPLDEQLKELEGKHIGERVQWILDNFKETYETAQECMQTNYYGAKHVTEAFLPLLHSSSSARIVNISSDYGLLKHFNNERVKQELDDIDNLTEERLDELITLFLEDFKANLLVAHGWPAGGFSAYKVAKTALNSYSRMLAKRYPAMRVNCVCPGFVKTGMGFGTGILSPEEGAEGPVMAALLPDGGPTGLYFDQTSPSACFVTGLPGCL